MVIRNVVILSRDEPTASSIPCWLQPVFRTANLSILL